jgi:acyl carrier protein
VSARRPLRERLGTARAAERAAILTEHIQEELQRALSLDVPPDPDAGFFDLGIDSATTAELGARLEEQLGGGCVLSATVLFDYPSVARLADHLARELPGSLPALADSPADLPSHGKGDIERWLSRLSEMDLDSLLDDHLNTFGTRNGAES